MTEIVSQSGHRRTWQAILTPRELVASMASRLFLRDDFPSRREMMAITPLRRGMLMALVALVGLAVIAPVGTIVALEIAIASQSISGGPGTSGTGHQESRSAAVYENILQRPLFSRNRQSLPTTPALAAPETVAPSRVMLDPSVALRGVFMNGDQAKAFLTSSDNPVGVWISANEQWSGWRIAEIRPNEVVLEAQGERQTLPLNVLAK